MKYSLLIVALLLFATACDSGSDKPTETGPTDTPAGADGTEPKTQGPEAVELFDAELADWQVIKFGGEGEVSYKDGVLNLDYGSPMTGYKYTGDIEKLFGENKENYEITLDAKRVEGVDMFLGLTFPVGKEGHVSLVLGGWAGAITGISNLDGLNASENKTTQYHAFQDGQWYKVRVRLTSEKIEAWLDDKQIIDVNLADHKEFTTHGAVVDTVPFGLFTYDTWGAYRDLKVRQLD